MTTTSAFLDSNRPDVPDIFVPRGVTPFHLPGRPVRGLLVRLGPLADALLTRHDNHPVVTALSDQALALAAALATALKFRASFSLQAKGDGAGPNVVEHACREIGAGAMESRNLCLDAWSRGHRPQWMSRQLETRRST